MIEFPCLVCDKPVATNHKFVCCDLHDKWVHIYCNNICKNTYQKLKKDNNPWLCKLCLQKKVPFSSLNNTEFSRLLNGKSIIPKKELKATPKIFEKLNIFTENENLVCKYYSNQQFEKLKKDNQDKNIFSLHLNTSSLPYHIDTLTNLLYDLGFNFKVIAITESRLTTKKDPKNFIEIPDYCIEYTATKSEKGGALLYISKEMNYKNSKI